MLIFHRETVTTRFIAPSGELAEKEIEIRTNPISGRTSRIAFSRTGEKEPGTEGLPPWPPNAADTENCPFCRPQVMSRTPRVIPEIALTGRMIRGDSILFPNLFPYGAYSAVSLFDNRHFVEIGTASLTSYMDCLINCAAYLEQILQYDPGAFFMAVTQNHLPSAGGSLLHPHLQINADRIPSNHQRFLRQRAVEYFAENGDLLFSDYLAHEKKEGSRYIGNTGPWEWMAAFAPEGFFEIWGILPSVTSFRQLSESDWEHMATGILHVQKFYRSLCRNGYNMGILLTEEPGSRMELRVVILVRSNYDAWVRNDHTGFELMIGDMTTFTSPEQTAQMARPFWEKA